jgi:type III restriction enzyme
MELKKYQLRVLDEGKTYLTELAAQQAAVNKHAALDAWENVRVPGRRYAERRNGLGKDMPNFCLKVPTGGGKTLLATQILGLIYSTMLEKRNGAGLALWVVPSDQIYKDTLKALRDRNHFYRFSLEHAVSRRVEVWEKHEIARLTPTQLSGSLNVLLFKLASANRETKDQLKMFQDSGGNIVMHFPAEDDAAANKALKEKFPNLDMLAENEEKGEFLVKTSLANLIRLNEPPVILDEGHKAYSELAQKTIEGFNASVVVELSATPSTESNILCRVNGEELLKEGMIKLPINICNSNEGRWENCLSKAKLKREELRQIAEKHYDKTHREIRPIVLIQVERTGKDQRKADVIHSEQVKEYLIQRLGVNETEIAIKSSEKDDIEGIALLAEGCRINWIITKAALQEGWDCPFAYILVSLNNTGSAQSMTQLIGRVLRQPFAERTEHKELNESYVYCLRQRADAIAKDVKNALEREGYEGGDGSVVDKSGERQAVEKQFSFFRSEFKNLYRPFDGKIYLPRFCVRDGQNYTGLDYFRHLISQVDVEKFRYDKLKWDLSDEMDKAKDFYYRATLGQRKLEALGQQEAGYHETDEVVRAWLVASLPYDYFSFKQLRIVVENFTARLCQLNPALKGLLGLVKFTLRNKCREFIETETDRLAEEAFDRLLEKDRLCFYLECVECRFQIPSSIELRSVGRLRHDDDTDVAKSLFDYAERAGFNKYEADVALVLDKHPEVLWWYQNKVGRDSFSIQGYRKNRIHPDFVVQNGKDQRPVARVVVVESKGQHLAGNPDTEYKRKIAGHFEKIGKEVSWQKLGEGFDKQEFRFQILDEGLYDSWRDELNRLLGSPNH